MSLIYIRVCIQINIEGIDQVLDLTSTIGALWGTIPSLNVMYGIQGRQTNQSIISSTAWVRPYAMLSHFIICSRLTCLEITC